MALQKLITHVKSACTCVYFSLFSIMLIFQTRSGATYVHVIPDVTTCHHHIRAYHEVSLSDF